MPSTIAAVLHARLEQIQDVPDTKIVVRFALTEGPRLVVVATDRWRLVDGGQDAPTFVVKAHEADLRELLDGHADLEAAMFDGRVRIAGDLGQAMRWVPVLLAPAH